MLAQPEVGLAEADRNISEAEHNIRQVESLLPQLASNGYPTAQYEGHIELMTHMLHDLRVQRRTIAENLEADRLIAAREWSQRHTQCQRASGGVLKVIYQRLRGDSD